MKHEHVKHEHMKHEHMKHEYAKCGTCPVSLNCWTNKITLTGYKCPECRCYIIMYGRYVWYTAGGNFSCGVMDMFCEYWYNKTSQERRYRINFIYTRDTGDVALAPYACPTCREKKQHAM